MKNLGSGKYVVPASDYWLGDFVDSKPTGDEKEKAMFRIAGDDDYKPLFLKEKPGATGANYVGYDNTPGDGSTVFLNKGGQNDEKGYIIYWKWPEN